MKDAIIDNGSANRSITVKLPILRQRHSSL